MNGEKGKEKEEGRKISRATSNLNTQKDHLFAVISHTLNKGVASWKYQGRVVHKPTLSGGMGRFFKLTRSCWNSNELFFHRISIVK